MTYILFTIESSIPDQYDTIFDGGVKDGRSGRSDVENAAGDACINQNDQTADVGIIEDNRTDGGSDVDDASGGDVEIIEEDMVGNCNRFDVKYNIFVLS